MRSTALPSHQYGDPMRVLEQKQASEARQERKRKAGTLRTKEGWSKERAAAEALFAPLDERDAQ